MTQLQAPEKQGPIDSLVQAGKDVAGEVKSLLPSRTAKLSGITVVGVWTKVRLTQGSWSYLDLKGDGSLEEVTGSNLGERSKGTWEMKDGQLVVHTESDTRYTLVVASKPDPMGGFHSVEQPGGTTFVLHPRANVRR